MPEYGLEAVELANARGYDLISLDMRMPVIVGFTAARKIRELERHESAPAVPIVANDLGFN
jgi:CheY-like chemotaxis protein